MNGQDIEAWLPSAVEAKAKENDEEITSGFIEIMEDVDDILGGVDDEVEDEISDVFDSIEDVFEDVINVFAGDEHGEDEQADEGTVVQNTDLPGFI